MQCKSEFNKYMKHKLNYVPITVHFVSYRVLVVLRLLLTLLPQTGYIHPDEYFQSIEVIAGEYFDIDVNEPWEFNATFPIRTIVIPYLTIGISYSILTQMSAWSSYIFGISLNVPYFLITFPRVFACCLSFISDYCLYKICCIYGRNYRSKLITYASSYVVVIYATRTFSNAVELLLTSMLLYFVAKSMACSDSFDPARHCYAQLGGAQPTSHNASCYHNSERPPGSTAEPQGRKAIAETCANSTVLSDQQHDPVCIVSEDKNLSEKYKLAETVVDRLKYFKLRAFLLNYSFDSCPTIAIITIIGFFNRPTFIAFALAPIFFWLQYGFTSKNVSFLNLNLQLFTFMLFSVLATALFIIIDSYYFGYLTLTEIRNFALSMNNFVVTPFNFIKYNTQTKNLSQHGIHPRFLNLVVNVPLLFNVLGVVGVFGSFSMLYRCCKAALSGKFELRQGQNITNLMTASFILPIFVLSMFPHQEPRFLIPVVLPLIFLHSQTIRQTSSIDNMTTSDTNEQTNVSFTRDKNKTKILLIVWNIVNILLTLFYGFLHQGGVLPLTTHFAAELREKPYLMNIHLFTSHIYSVPTALLQLRNTRKTYMTLEHREYKLAKDFYLYEQGSENVEEIHANIVQKIQECEKKLHSHQQPYRLYYALPASFLDEFQQYIIRNNSYLFNYNTVKMFYPHVSTEWLPKLKPITNCTESDDLKMCMINMVGSIVDFFPNFARQLGLILLKIESPNVTESHIHAYKKQSVFY